MHRPAEYINNDIYPLDNPGSDDWKHLVDQCRSSLDETGVCILKEFVQKKLINKMAHEADQYIHLSHFSEDSHNVFFQDDDAQRISPPPLGLKKKIGCASSEPFSKKKNFFQYFLKID